MRTEAKLWKRGNSEVPSPSLPPPKRKKESLKRLSFLVTPTGLKPVTF